MKMIKAAVIVCAVFCLCFLGFRLTGSWQQRKQAEQQKRAAAGTRAAAEEEGKAGEQEEYVSPINFEELRAINPDTVAWITIPGTDIDYPVVQTLDNETYLDRGFDGKRSKSGAIYLDCDSDGDLLGTHSLLYGHHMKNQTMFAQIVKFKDEDFFDSHREIRLYTPQRELRLKTIAAVCGDDDGEKRRTKFESPGALRRYMGEMTKTCPFRELPEGEIQCLYSFVTCSYEFKDARTILYAVREEEMSPPQAVSGTRDQ